jgi:hypothetical protein
MKLREYSHPRERVHSVRRPRFIEKEIAVGVETDEAEGSTHVLEKKFSS